MNFVWWEEGQNGSFDCKGCRPLVYTISNSMTHVSSYGLHVYRGGKKASGALEGYEIYFKNVMKMLIINKTKICARESQE